MLSHISAFRDEATISGSGFLLPHDHHFKLMYVTYTGVYHLSYRLWPVPGLIYVLDYLQSFINSMYKHVLAQSQNQSHHGKGTLFLYMFP